MIFFLTFNYAHLLSVLILLVLQLAFWLSKDSNKIYWYILEFKIRHTPLLKGNRCSAIGGMFNRGRKISVNPNFFKKDYPDISEKSFSVDLVFQKKKDYPKIHYRLLEVVRVPGGYVVARINETKMGVSESTGKPELWGGDLYHTVVYRKDFRGQYYKVDRCMKTMG